ncbi:MAG: hypothetical protein ACQETR_11940 [Thermodesulfobacteriota bacterium]
MAYFRLTSKQKQISSGRRTGALPRQKGLNTALPSFFWPLFRRGPDNLVMELVFS